MRFLEEIRFSVFHLQTGIHGRPTADKNKERRKKEKKRETTEGQRVDKGWIEGGNDSRRASLVARNSTRAFLEFPAVWASPEIQILHAHFHGNGYMALVIVRRRGHWSLFRPFAR